MTICCLLVHVELALTQVLDERSLLRTVLVIDLGDGSRSSMVQPEVVTQIPGIDLGLPIQSESHVL